jgi:translocation and assembly module TamB
VRRGWIILGVVLLLLAGAAVMLGHRLLYTQAGLDFVVRRLGSLQDIRIEVTGARGTLAGPLSVDRIVVDHEAVHIDARGIRVVSRPRGLIVGRVTLDGLSASKVSVRLKHRPPQPEKPPGFLPARLSFEAPAFRLANIDVTLLDGQRIEAKEATGSLTLTRWRMDLDPVAVRGPQGQVEGTLVLRATEPLGIRANLRGEWRFPQDAFEYRFRVESRGKLDRLGLNAFLDSPARLSFVGTLLDVTEQPRATGTFRFTDFDGSPWVPAGRYPMLSGSVTLAAGTTSLGLDGTLTTPALPGQQVRLQAGGRWKDRTLDIASLRAWLPRIGLELRSSGTVRLADADAPEGTLPLLKLAGEWSALRWPLGADTEAIVSSPQGSYTLEGSLPYAFTARAQVEGIAIPTTSFDAVGKVDKAGVVLDRFEGYALRGRIDGRGRLSWAGNQPWNFEVNARSISVAELRPGVAGLINATGTIAGTGLSAAAPWTARLASLSGTMFGRALTGRGEIAHRDGVYALRGVRIVNGSSFAEVNGRIGASVLDVAWNADLRSLAVVLPGMSGQLVSQGTARGTLERPLLNGSARLRQFSYGGISVASAQADIDVDTSDHRRSRVAIDAVSLEAGGLMFDSVGGGLDGFMREHAVTLVFRSPGSPERRITEFRGELRAFGAIDMPAKTWTGDLVQADVVFPDGAARLLQPSALVLGPDLQRASPLCLRTVEDARLCVEGEHHASPVSWRFIYSAQDWPLQRVLRTVLGWREFDGRLQASGWAERAPGKDWVGGSTLLVHEPSFDVPRNKFRTERISMGGGRVDLYAEPTEIRATINLDVDESTGIQGEAFVARRTGDLLASPLRGNITARSEAIKMLPLLVPEIDRAVGRLNGQVTFGGTLGRPEFNGEFQLRDGRLELYRTNLVVSSLTADGTFVGDELQFAATGSTAKGHLKVDGNFTWPKGVMAGAMRLRGNQLLIADTPEYRVMASPDIVLLAGADGYRVEGEVVIPSARISPRELTTSVSTSLDERIVGLDDVGAEEDAKPATSDRITTRVRVRLGDNVRVEAYGLKARLDGSVVVSQLPDDVMRGDGTIKVAEGQYKAFGQDVRITKCLLSYANTPLTEPLLDIVAERKIKDADITVAVNVRGTLDRPFITVTSTPAMSSNEALSYLLTGRSIDTLQSGEAANVNKAAENLAVSGGGLLLGGIGTRLGLDEVSLERTGDEDTSVVLGKFLSPKLFVSYGISIAEAINTIKLRYTLNDRWSLKAEAGLEQSADVEYRIER